MWISCSRDGEMRVYQGADPDLKTDATTQHANQTESTRVQIQRDLTKIQPWLYTAFGRLTDLVMRQSLSSIDNPLQQTLQTSHTWKKAYPRGSATKCPNGLSD